MNFENSNQKIESVISEFLSTVFIWLIGCVGKMVHAELLFGDSIYDLKFASDIRLCTNHNFTKISSTRWKITLFSLFSRFCSWQSLNPGHENIASRKWEPLPDPIYLTCRFFAILSFVVELNTCNWGESAVVTFDHYGWFCKKWMCSNIRVRIW